MDSGLLVDASSVVVLMDSEWLFFFGRDRGKLVVVVVMSVTSVLICRRMLPRVCSGEFFTFCYYSRILEQHYTLSDGKHWNNTYVFVRSLFFFRVGAEPRIHTAISNQID